MTDEARFAQFLAGLAELTRKTGVIIGGCGCCGSPHLRVATELAPEAGYGFAGGVHWISPDDDYDWEEYSASIVRHVPRAE